MLSPDPLPGALMVFEAVTTTLSRSLVFYVLRALVLLPLGLLAVLLGLLLLWVNEGIDPRAELAEAAAVLPADDTRRAPSGLVSVTGELRATTGVGDPVFLDEDPTLLALLREVEIFAWHEVAYTEEERRLGGGRTLTTTYSYVPAWTSHPPDHTLFHVPEGHENPPLRVTPQRWVSETAHVGSWAVPGLASFPLLPGEHGLFLDTVSLRPPAQEARRQGNTLYLDDADPAAPSIGDHRVRFRGVRAGDLVTAFGAASKGSLVPLETRSVPYFFDVLEGDREAALVTLRAEDDLRLIVLRIIGVLLLWVGFFLSGSLTVAFLDIIPLAGTVGRVVIGLLAIPMTLVLGISTIVLSQIGHNPWATAGILLGMVGIIWLVYTVGPVLQARRKQRLREATDMHEPPRPVDRSTPPSNA